MPNNKFTVEFTNKDIIDEIRGLSDEVRTVSIKHDERLRQLEKTKERSGALFASIDQKIKKNEDTIKNVAKKQEGIESNIAVIKKRSLGCWIYTKPLTFSALVVIFFATVISDFRNPIIGLIKSLFL